MEEKISKKKAVELFENEYLDNYEVGTFAMLAAIHKYLFDEIYDFAGKVRTVNIAKGNFRFASVMYLQAALENVEKMPQSTFDEIKMPASSKSTWKIYRKEWSYACVWWIWRWLAWSGC